MKQVIQFHVYKGDAQFVAEGIDLPIVTQAATLDDLARNIQEAVELHLEDANLKELGIGHSPSVLFNVELPAHA